jgi:hypothetical protein
MKKKEISYSLIDFIESEDDVDTFINNLLEDGEGQQVSSDFSQLQNNIIVKYKDEDDVPKIEKKKEVVQEKSFYTPDIGDVLRSAMTGVGSSSIYESEDIDYKPDFSGLGI